jgi:hypothetical protein
VSGAKLECQTNNRRIKCDVDGKALALEVSIKRETQKRRVLDEKRQQARGPKSNDSENCQKAHRPDEEVAWSLELHGATWEMIGKLQRSA